MDPTTIVAISGVLVSLIVGFLTFFASRRSTATTRALGDTAARDRLIDQLQERVDQQERQLAACERGHQETRHQLDTARDASDALTAELSQLRRDSDRISADLREQVIRLETRITLLSGGRP